MSSLTSVMLKWDSKVRMSHVVTSALVFLSISACIILERTDGWFRLLWWIFIEPTRVTDSIISIHAFECFFYVLFTL